MKKTLILLFTAGMLGFYSCDIDKTKDGEMPTVDVDVETTPGEMPEYDVDWVDVDVKTRTKVVTVPKVKIVMEEEEIEVPYIEANWPDDMEDVMEQTIAVEAEVVGKEYDLDIKEVYADGDRLYVISELEATDTEIGEQSMRVSDQVVINAPDLTVKHYIIGDKPDRGFNNAYTYVADRSKIEKRLTNARKIYGS